MEVFEIQCKSAKTADDIQKIVQVITKSMQNSHDFTFYPHRLYNKYIGWALPTEKVLKLIVNFWKENPNSTIVDLGAGSGFFCLLFYDHGIPKTKLIALETKMPTRHQTISKFWNIIQDDDYEIDVNDICFIAWGSGIQNRLKSYVERGGKYVIILGEIEDGCTFPSDYFEKDKKWKCVLIHVQGPASNFSEYLSINTRLP